MFRKSGLCILVYVLSTVSSARYKWYMIMMMMLVAESIYPKLLVMSFSSKF